MGHSDKLGKVQPGYYANVILVDGNPLNDIEVLQHTSKLHAIIISGHVHKNLEVVGQGGQGRKVGAKHTMYNNLPVGTNQPPPQHQEGEKLEKNGVGVDPRHM